MDKDREDLLDLSIGIVEMELGRRIPYEELYPLLDYYFGSLRFTMDEIMEHSFVGIDEEDAKLILKNSGND